MYSLIHLQTGSQTIPGITIDAHIIQTITKNITYYAGRTVDGDNQTVDCSIRKNDVARDQTMNPLKKSLLVLKQTMMLLKQTLVVLYKR